MALIATYNTCSLGATTLSKMTISITTLSMNGLLATFSIILNAIMLSVAKLSVVAQFIRLLLLKNVCVCVGVWVGVIL